MAERASKGTSLSHISINPEVQSKAAATERRRAQNRLAQRRCREKGIQKKQREQLAQQREQEKKQRVQALERWQQRSSYVPDCTSLESPTSSKFDVQTPHRSREIYVEEVARAVAIASNNTNRDLPLTHESLESVHMQNVNRAVNDPLSNHDSLQPGYAKRPAGESADEFSLNVEVWHPKPQQYDTISPFDPLINKSLTPGSSWRSAQRSSSLNHQYTVVAPAEHTPKVVSANTSLLHAAIQAGNVQEVQTMIVRHGADPNELNEDGQNALHIAVGRNGCADVVKMLLRYHTRADCADRQGLTPFQLAMNSQYWEIAALLEPLAKRDEGLG